MEAEVVNLGKEIDRLERQAAIDAEMAKATSAPITNKPSAKMEGAAGKTGRASDEYKSAFWTGAIRNKMSFDVQNALSIGTDSEGGFLAPDEYERTWWKDWRRRTSLEVLLMQSELPAGS